MGRVLRRVVFHDRQRGIHRYLFWRETDYLPWTNLTSAKVEEENSPEITRCTITLTSSNRTLTISSDLFSLDEVQNIAKELETEKLIQGDQKNCADKV